MAHVEGERDAVTLVRVVDDRQTDAVDRDRVAQLHAWTLRIGPTGQHDQARGVSAAAYTRDLADGFDDSSEHDLGSFTARTTRAHVDVSV